jgi:hypothetical protein
LGHEQIQDLLRASSHIENSGLAQSLVICSIELDVPKLVDAFPRETAAANGGSPAQPRGGRYVPPYISFMLDASEKLGLSAERRPPKDELERYLEQNWPSHLGRPSGSKLGYMSTFLRHPEDEKGGHFRPSRRTKGRTPNSL